MFFDGLKAKYLLFTGRQIKNNSPDPVFEHYVELNALFSPLSCFISKSIGYKI